MEDLIKTIDVYEHYQYNQDNWFIDYDDNRYFVSKFKIKDGVEHRIDVTKKDYRNPKSLYAYYCGTRTKADDLYEISYIEWHGKPETKEEKIKEIKNSFINKNKIIIVPSYINIKYIGKIRVEHLPNNCFYKCREAELLYIPNTIRRIDYNITEECNNLKTVIIDKCKKDLLIHQHAFFNTPNLEKIIFRDRVLIKKNNKWKIATFKCGYN